MGLLRDELRKVQASWRQLDHERYSVGEDVEGEFSHEVINRLDDLNEFVQKLKDNREYLDTQYFEYFLKAAAASDSAQAPVREIFQSFTNSVTIEWEEAYAIYGKAQRIFEVTEGILKITSERLFADYGAREASEVYCQNIVLEYLVKKPKAPRAPTKH